MSTCQRRLEGGVTNAWLKTREKDNLKKRVVTSNGIGRKVHAREVITSKSATQVSECIKTMIKQAEDRIKEYKEELNEVSKNMHIAWNRNREIDLCYLIDEQNKWIKELKNVDTN